MMNIMAYQCVYVYFIAHQAKIAQNLCVKRKIKNNTCQGKCHLKKMAKRSETSTQKVQEELKLDLMCMALQIFKVTPIYISKVVPQSFYLKAPVLAGHSLGVHAPPDFHFSV
jgi:hypothetical protein